MDAWLSYTALAEVQRLLKCVEYRWYDIGLQLGLNPAKLESIRQTYHSPGECLVEMIRTWLKGRVPVPTWEELCLALEGEVLEEAMAAQRIREEKGAEDKDTLAETPNTPGLHPSTTDNLFRYMRTDHLSETEEQRLIGRLEGESQSIRLEFARLIHTTGLELKAKNINHKMLIQKLSFYDTSLTEECSYAESIDDVIFTVNDYWSFFNYDLLEYIVDVFGLRNTNFEQYARNFEDFCRRRLCECRSDVAGHHNDAGRRIVMKLDNKMSIQRSTLQDLRRLQDQASKVTGVNALQLLRIEDGCLHLIYRIPHASIKRINFLSAEKKQELTDIGILSVTCEKKMVKWQLGGSQLRNSIAARKATIIRERVVITELATYKTEIELALGVGAEDQRLRIKADVKVTPGDNDKDDKARRKADRISVKIVPAIHRNKEAHALQVKQMSFPLEDFVICDIMSPDALTQETADIIYEFYVELHINSKSSRLVQEKEKHGHSSFTELLLAVGRDSGGGSDSARAVTSADVPVREGHSDLGYYLPEEGGSDSVSALTSADAPANTSVKENGTGSGLSERDVLKVAYELSGIFFRRKNTALSTASDMPNQSVPSSPTGSMHKLKSTSKWSHRNSLPPTYEHSRSNPEEHHIMPLKKLQRQSLPASIAYGLS